MYLLVFLNGFTPVLPLPGCISFFKKWRTGKLCRESDYLQNVGALNMNISRKSDDSGNFPIYNTIAFIIIVGMVDLYKT